jgi:hypothetical protein
MERITDKFLDDHFTQYDTGYWRIDYTTIISCEGQVYAESHDNTLTHYAEVNNMDELNLLLKVLKVELRTHLNVLEQYKEKPKFRIWGINKKYKSLSWFENFMGGYIDIGKNITIFGENAMHWAICIRTKKYGTIVLTLPLRCFGKYWGCHIYISPNGTPWASTYYKSLWKENNKDEEIKAQIRKLNFGHNFKGEENNNKLRYLNDTFSARIHDYQVQDWLRTHLNE